MFIPTSITVEEIRIMNRIKNFLNHYDIFSLSYTFFVPIIRTASLQAVQQISHILHKTTLMQYIAQPAFGIYVL